MISRVNCVDVVLLLRLLSSMTNKSQITVYHKSSNEKNRRYLQGGFIFTRQENVYMLFLCTAYSLTRNSYAVTRTRGFSIFYRDAFGLGTAILNTPNFNF